MFIMFKCFFIIFIFKIIDTNELSKIINNSQIQINPLSFCTLILKILSFF